MNVLFLLIKGRNFKESLFVLRYVCIFIRKKNFKNRNLYIQTEFRNFYILFIKNSDFRTYIKSNCFDFILIGEDMVFYSKNFNNFYEYKILKINIFFLSIISNNNYKFKKKKYLFFSKYVNIINNYLIYKNFKNFNLKKLKGAVENACILNNSIIFDIVSSGITIKNNNLFELKKIIELNCYIIYSSNILYNKIFLYMENLNMKSEN